jgi:acetoacetyl-CoA synthetase
VSRGHSDPGEILWYPSPERVEHAAITRYQSWLARSHGLDFDTYEDLRQWSITDLSGFWGSMWQYFDVEASDAPTAIVTGDESMLGVRWFQDARLNYVNRALAGDDDHLAILAHDESGLTRSLTLTELRQNVAKVAAGLRDAGVAVGDRVASYLPNIPETVVAFLATASVGAIWVSCAPEFGVRSVIDRLAQVGPKVLFGAMSYEHGGKRIDRATELGAIHDALPSLALTVALGDVEPIPSTYVSWELFGSPGADLDVVSVPADHPLWIVYSSGTTGLPKPIMHSHGGIMLEHLKSHELHLDIGSNDRFFWYTSTGWVMWNLLVGGLLVNATVVLYDGSPIYPSRDQLWTVAEQSGSTFFGAGAPYLEGVMRAGHRPSVEHDLSKLRTIGSTGAPLSIAAYDWIYRDAVADVLLASISGGTDVCTAFVGSLPTLPVRAGEMQCRWLGSAVEAFNDTGESVIGKVGELVVTRPMPSMPLGFWGDTEQSRYQEAYFRSYPNAWRHGDWLTITPHGGCVISGRSDSTLKRGGVRMGTMEIYQVVEDLPEVLEALAADTSGPGGSGELVLFVVMADGTNLDDQSLGRIRVELATQLSPRHVPDHVIAIPAVPRTLNGKKLEVPVKRLLLGSPLEEVVSTGSVQNIGALDALVEAAVKAGLMA